MPNYQTKNFHNTRLEICCHTNLLSVLRMWKPKWMWNFGRWLYFLVYLI